MYLIFIICAKFILKSIKFSEFLIVNTQKDCRVVPICLWSVRRNFRLHVYAPIKDGEVIAVTIYENNLNELLANFGISY